MLTLAKRSAARVLAKQINLLSPTGHTCPIALVSLRWSLAKTRSDIGTILEMTSICKEKGRNTMRLPLPKTFQCFFKFSGIVLNYPPLPPSVSGLASLRKQCTTIQCQLQEICVKISIAS